MSANARLNPLNMYRAFVEVVWLCGSGCVLVSFLRKSVIGLSEHYTNKVLVVEGRGHATNTR